MHSARSRREKAQMKRVYAPAPQSLRGLFAVWRTRIKMNKYQGEERRRKGEIWN
jgi:hypothetical protein